VKKIFDGNVFSPYVRYSVDIRDILPKIITRLQKLLSKQQYSHIYYVGKDSINSENLTHYDFLNYNNHIINSFPKKQREELKYQPKPIILHIEDKIIKGVECKIGLYVNDNPIVERLFYVDRFNPDVRWSVDIVECVVDITNQIFEKMKMCDIINMQYSY